ncbi:efflux RND transporter periplasmic adaptor subunit [Pseudoalteromonas rubra]|nr:efflux RND transporter periplasmic adaptor subunit [Pseudoalteromonas rubra]
MCLVLFIGCFELQCATLKSVTTTEIKRSHRSQPVNVSGKLARKTIVRLAFNIDGLVDKVNVQKGDVLAQGQLLATLDSREIRAKVQSATSAHKTALEDHQRISDLYNKNLLPLSEVQQSQNRLEAASSALEIAAFNESLSTIRAPMGGVVVEKLVEENELIKAQQTAFMIAVDENGWIVTVEVPDHDVVRMKIGDPATVTLSAYNSQTFDGHISEIAGQANAQGLFSVDVKLNQHQETFRVGYLASVEILPQDQQLYSYISLDSVVEVNQRKAKFFTIDRHSSKVTKRVLEVAFLTDDAIAVKAAMGEHEEVVTQGAEMLEDGEEVVVLEGL